MCEHEEVIHTWPADPKFAAKRLTPHEQPQDEHLSVIQEQPTDAAELQSDELEVLESILGDDFIQVASKDSSNNNNNNNNNNNSLIFIARSQQLSAVAPEYFLTVEIRLPALYPHCLPTITSITSNCGVLSNSMEDDLYLELATHANSLLGEPMLYDLFTLTCDFLCNKIITRDVPMLRNSSLEFNQSRGNMLEKALCPDVVMRREKERVAAELAEIAAAARAAQEADGEYDDWFENEDCAESPEVYSARLQLYKAESQAAAKAAQAAAAFDYGNKNTLSVQHNILNCPTFSAAHHWVGTMASIFSHIPDDVSVLKIEVILNTYLCHEFQKYSNSASREVVFHGTSAANVDSIVKNGMWTDVRAAHGRVYGDGVYVSKSPSVSQSYVCGMGYIFVCAAVDVKWHLKDRSIGTVRNNTMLLPCYLLRVQHYGSQGRTGSGIKATPSGFLYAEKLGAEMTEDQEEKMSNAHQMTVVAKEAAINNASFYIDVKKYKVLDVAVVDEDDDGTTYDASNDMQPLRMSAATGSVSVYDLIHDTTFQSGRHAAPMRSKAQHDRLLKQVASKEASNDKKSKNR